MSTNLQVVTTALRMLTVLDSTETPSAEDGAAALEQQNDLFAILLADGIDLGYPAQDSLIDEFPLDATVEAQIKPLLAMKLHGIYPSVSVPPSVAALAAGVMKQLQRDAVLENMQESSVTHAPLGVGSTWDILTDE